MNDRIKDSGMEAFNPAECDEHNDFQVLDSETFLENTPIFENVLIVEKHGYWDGVMSGICETHGQQFYFDTLVESIWRYYNKQFKKVYNGKKFQHISRLWRVFAVYDIKPELVKPLLEKKEKIADNCNIIGIFWDYKYKDQLNKSKMPNGSGKED